MILIDDMEALYKRRFYYVCDNYELFTDKSKYGNKFTIRDYHRGQLLQFTQLNNPYKILVEYIKDDALFGPRKYLMNSTEEALVDVCLWGFDTASSHDYGHKELSRIVTSRDEIIFAINSAYNHVGCGDSENEKYSRFTSSPGFMLRWIFTFTWIAKMFCGSRLLRSTRGSLSRKRS